jgi:hypothetical protein
LNGSFFSNWFTKERQTLFKRQNFGSMTHPWIFV